MIVDTEQTFGVMRVGPSGTIFGGKLYISRAEACKAYEKMEVIEGSTVALVVVNLLVKRT